VNRTSMSGKLFNAGNGLFLTALAIVCVLPLVNILALSLSSSTSASAGLVKLWPVEFTLKSYQFILQEHKFLQAFGKSVQRLAAGTAFNLFMTVLVAYALSKEKAMFKGRTFYAWFFVLTMLIQGGLIPWYLIIKSMGLLNSIWALILPGAVPVFNVVVLLNFFRGLPKAMEEAAFIDGAGHWTILWRIYVPLSGPALATITLFTMVYHWNAWFDGLILMNSPDRYPLQSYLQTVVIHQDLNLIASTDLDALSEVSDRTLKAAQIFLAGLPILAGYPFLQRYFIKGVVLGSVKE